MIPRSITNSVWISWNGSRMRDARQHDWEYEYDPATGMLLRADDPSGGFKQLSRSGPNANYEVTLTTGENRVTRYQVERLPAGEKERRTIRPDGTAADTLITPAGQRVATAADGTIRSVTRGGDPRFGMAAPLPAETTVSTPGGLTRITTTERMLLLSNPSDPLTLVTQTDTVSVNGRPYVSELQAGPPAVRTDTSPELRQTISTLDEQGRLVESAVNGLHPVRRVYDSNGRLSQVIHGPTPDPQGEARTTTFVYKTTADTQNGLLDHITDPAGRVISFTYDDAGRVEQQVFQPATPDERVISYAYDANGNLTSATPPGTPLHPHAFSYSEVNLEGSYTPPMIPLVPNPETTYTYNLDRQLTAVMRPDGQTIDYDYDPAGRLETLTIQPGNETRTYAYNTATGRLSTLSGPDAELSFAFDGPLLTAETWTGPLAGS